jgi:hypothetical protein
MGHLTGDIFLSNWQTDDLGSIIEYEAFEFKDSVYTLYDRDQGGYFSVPVHYTYHKRGLDSVFIGYHEYAAGGLDSLAFEEIEESIYDYPEFLRFGDALITGKLYGYDIDNDTPGFATATAIPQAGKPVKLAQGNMLERVNFQISANRKYQEEVALMMADIMNGVESGEIRLFEQGYNINEPTESLIDIDDAFVKYYEEDYFDEFMIYEEDLPYYQHDIVDYDGKSYISLKNDNLGKKPSENSEFWELYSIEAELYPAEELHILDIKYKLTFTNKGKVKSKVPEAITLIVPAEYSIHEITFPLGTITFNDLLKYKEEHNSAPWVSLLKRIEDQQSVKFEMRDYGPVMVAEKN